MTLHPTLAALFRALDEVDVVWCVLRGEEDLASPAGDVDLLVAEAHVPGFRGVATGLGFASVPAWGYGSHLFFVGYDPARDTWIKLDVVTELAFGRGFALATGAEADVLARRRRVDGAWVPDRDDAFWTLLLHRLLDKGGIGPAAAERLAALAPEARADGALGRAVDPLCPAGWSAADIASAARRHEWDALSQLGPDLAASWSRRRRGDVRRRATANTLRQWSGKLRRTSRRRGMKVALLAPDGAGKSTLSRGIETDFYFPVRSIHMGLYQAARPRGRRHVPGIGLAAQLSAQWAGWLRGAYHQRRGRLVLYDRYAYDALLPTRFRYSRRGRARRWLLAHACPAPELVVFLDAPGEVLHARKGEKTVDLLESQRRAYRTLLARVPRVAVVDASRDADTVRPEVTAIIWGEYRRRWNGREDVASQARACGS
ncbi:MAG TPA: hypothetical protein VH650_00840 [Gaiellaceae bacterium]